MSVLIIFILLICGFALLILGAHWLVEGASALALRLSITPIVIGLTVVSFGTSTPELIVNIFAASTGNSSVCFGNVIGSNISNILLILGFSALVYPLHIQHNTVWKEIPFSLMAVIALIILCNDVILANSPNVLSRGDGLILFLFFVLFFTYIFSLSRINTTDQPLVKRLSLLKIWIYIFTGLFLLIVGGRFVVNNAVKLAHFLNISESVVSLTVVAIGTSLPELFTTAVAAYKKEMDIAIGNIVGSNIFNIYFILGCSAVIHPLSFQSGLNIQLIILLITTFLLFFSMFTGKRKRVDRWEGAVFCILYLFYIVYLFQIG